MRVDCGLDEACDERRDICCRGMRDDFESGVVRREMVGLRWKETVGWRRRRRMTTRLQQSMDDPAIGLSLLFLLEI
jgi:hypothetical protein